jgi:ribonucleoside-triphosphate reductase
MNTIMKVIKRNGKEVDYDPSKIFVAISKANKNVLSNERLSDDEIYCIINNLNSKFATYGRAIDIEEIQDAVEDAILSYNKNKLAKAYIKYRYKRAMLRSNSQVDNNIMTLIRNDNEEIKQENSNKNPTIVSVMRDYMAGEVSKDITRRILLAPDIVEAHDQGIIHFHDADYFAQPMYNCCLLNLDDMLQNGTVISNTKIIKPHSFHTACNIATQIIAQTASSQYGGTSISLTHLAKFVNVSRVALRDEVRKEFEDAGIALTEHKINEIAEKRLRKEIRRGVQTLQYQIITLNTTNG